MKEFKEISNFPGVFGAIDCTHIPISSPGGENAELYRNRKGYFSINVQVVGDAKLKIQNIVARWPGSTHDATIFDNSSLSAQCESNRFPINGYMLGDSGYPCRPYLLTPLLNPNTPAEFRYNVSHIRTRNTVERLFGIWKRRFPCLKFGLQLKLQTSLIVIIATAVLNNIATENNLDDNFPIETNTENEASINSNFFHKRSTNAIRSLVINQYFQ